MHSLVALSSQCETNCGSIHRRIADTRKFTTGLLLPRFPRIDGLTKLIESPTLFLAGFTFLGIEFLLSCVTRKGHSKADFRRIYAPCSHLWALRTRRVQRISPFNSVSNRGIST
jgi:hypothetical protein